MTNKVRLYRHMRGGVTQADLAKAAGVTRQTIIAIEQGRFNPSVRLALKIARILEATVEELFFLEEDRSNEVIG
jgi:putative transcriptional regulator